ncbi:MAG: hypothetical protein E3J72_14135 [Planctomycetota bacterium]|nr:MAG: hypothetical protein E3J72_14135 [Planctomycetota bacterium]
MVKLLLAVILVAVMTVFAMNNMHRVELGLIIGRPVHVRLFFLLMTSYLLGCFSAILVRLFLNTRTKKKGKAVQETETEGFFFE